MPAMYTWTVDTVDVWVAATSQEMNLDRKTTSYTGASGETPSSSQKRRHALQPDL